MTQDAPPAQRRERLDTLAVSLLLVCCTLWGLNQVAAKVALADVPPLTQAALRSLGAALLVLAWARWRGIALFERDLTLRGGLLAGALFAAEFACIFVGLQYTSASRMVVFIYLSPFVVALGMPLVARGERLSAGQWTGLAAAFAGVAWAFAEGFAPSAKAPPLQWFGDALGLGGGAAVGCDHAGDPGYAPVECRGREDAALSARTVGRTARGGRAAGRRVVAAGVECAVDRLAAVPDRDRHLRELFDVVLARAPLPGHAHRRLHAADAGGRAWPRACCCSASR